MQNRQRHVGLLVSALTLVALAVPAAAPAWTWPVQGPVLQSFDFDELNPKAPGQHRGISIGSPTGTPVQAPVDAIVTFAGTVPSGGKTLSLLTAQGLSVTLVHLGSFSVFRDAKVMEGQTVGRVGPSGVSELTVPYVYLGVRRVEDPQGYLDPLLFLPTGPVPPAPVEPPAPEPGPAPTPVAPPVPVVPPPPPVTPGAEQPSPPRPALPSSEAPERPLPTLTREPLGAVGPSGHVSSEPRIPRASSLHAAASTNAYPTVNRPVHAATAASAGLAAPAPSTTAKPAAPEAWLRTRDGWVEPTAPVFARTGAGGSRKVPVPALALAALAVVGLLLLLGRGGRGKGARIIAGDALLPDNADLLRQRESAHRARVHDDRRGRARPAPQAAR